MLKPEEYRQTDLFRIFSFRILYSCQVRRNNERFPEDFMFELTKEEYEYLRCHFGTLKCGEHSK